LKDPEDRSDNENNAEKKLQERDNWVTLGVLQLEVKDFVFLLYSMELGLELSHFVLKSPLSSPFAEPTLLTTSVLLVFLLKLLSLFY
jgi:hypothetical protein